MLSLLKPRARSTIETLEEAVHTIEDNKRLHKTLLDLRKLFEAISVMLYKCLPKQSSSLLGKVKRNAQRMLSSGPNLKILLDYSNKLDRIKQDVQEVMQLFVVTRQKANRREDEEQLRQITDALRVLKISKDTRGDPALQLAKRQLKGTVIYEELKELDESLGSGSFGVVMEGTYYGKPVAIKRALNPLFSAQEKENFR